MRSVLVVEASRSTAEELTRALADERVVAVATADEAVHALRDGAFRVGVARPPVFRDATTVAALGCIPWIPLVETVDEELGLLGAWPDLDVCCLVADRAGRYLHLLPHRVRRTSPRERLVSTIAEHFPGMVAYWDKHERCRFANAAYLDWFGITRAELYTMPLRELLGPIYAPNEPHIRGALRGEVQRFERSIPSRRGCPPRHSLVIYTPDARNGEVDGFVAVIADVSERHALEQALQERERGWQALFEILPVGVSVVDGAGAVVEMNSTLSTMLDLDMDDLAQGKHMRRHYVRPDGSPFDAADFPSTRARSDGRVCGPVEIGVVKEDGDTSWTSVTAAPFADEDKVVVVTRDVTQERLRAARFQAIVEASTVPYALNDAEGNITYLNSAFVRTFGYTRQDIPTLERWWPQAYPDEEYRRWVATQWQARLERSRREGVAFEPMELAIRAKDRSQRSARVGAVALEGSFAGEHLVVLVDVTEQRRAEAERMHAEKLELDAQKMEALGALAGGIAHDFNNILVPIMAQSELALGEVAPDSGVHASLSEIQGAAHRAASLVRQILAFSRPDGDDPSAVDVGRLVEEVAQLLRASLPSTIALRTEIAPGCPPVFANATRVHQVILNLVTNARDAIGSRGEVTIHVDRDASGGVKLGVKDTGEGMPPDVIRRAFEPYFTTKVGGKGTGLGLATVHAIVTSMAGRIAIESEPGAGTRVEVVLPVARTPTQREARTAQAPAGRGEHILVVDDEKAVARTLTRTLEHLGYRVTAVTEPRAALDVVRQDASLDAVITDYTMPGMTGLQLATEIEKLRPLPIVIATGFSARALQAESTDAGARRLLHKPFTREVLAEAIGDALNAARRDRSS